MGNVGRKFAKAAAGLGIAGAAWLMWSGEASAAPKPSAPACTDPTAVTNVTFSDQDGNTASPGYLSPVLDIVDPGDTITVTFDVVETQDCPSGVELTLVSYGTQTEDFVPGAAQDLFEADTNTFAPGTGYTLVVEIPEASPSGSDPLCNPQDDNSSGAPDGGGANQSPGPYDPNGCGLPSGNGKSTDNNSSKPCAGCVGNADAKNPPGQYPNGLDPNAGYECDRNQGVGQTNPAHTGCSLRHFQLDFVFGHPITDFRHTSYSGEGRLINWANG